MENLSYQVMMDELKYAGEELLPESSILRRLPASVSTELRMRLDAIAFVADSLYSAWRTMFGIATAIGPDVARFDNHSRTVLLASAWAIVDQLNALRQIVVSLPGPTEGAGPLTIALLTAIEPARRLRNGMQHLNQKIPNLANQKGRKSALFGSLSYFLTADVRITRGYIATVQAGLVHENEVWDVVNPAGRTISMPADLFTLSAFGERLELGPPIAAFKRWLAATSESSEKQLQVAIARAAAEQGVSEEELMQHAGGGYAFVLSIDFTTDSETALAEE